MSIELQFNQIAQEYDANRKKFIPCFDDYYQSTTAFIAANINPPKNIVDLGSGTGLLAYYWYQHFPDANYLLVDIADDMLNVAKRRFCEVDNVSYQLIDYTKELPNALFDTVISALSIHHLTHSEKQALFAKIYQALPKNGVFVNYDQFCAGDNQINLWYEHYWENHLTHSGLTDKDLALWQERRKLDKECSVEEECAMLKQSGFTTAKCVYTHQKFSVIVALK
ncbi:MAG: class I SAM-dependent methyltransferase [Neisseriaceae bacterium]|nr:class I SAM-dependent methyltransferase [Neisseriaceae bacterium]MBO7554678.1 class I SAM-dependent methyltransferase [Neisseriaceae bacterium]MBP5789301.1 class I SAM-dependent methyltransferase [Neisseriaceae bacterium]